MKRILSIVLIFVMMSSICLNVFASKEINYKYLSIHKEKIKTVTGSYKNDIVIKKLTDFSGNEFELIETGKYGYYIFDANSGRYLEYSKVAPSPYLGKYGELKYFGPKCYYTSNNEKYTHTIITYEKDLGKEDLSIMQNSFSKMIKQVREIKDNNVLPYINEINLGKPMTGSVGIKSETPVYIDDYTYVRDDPYPVNELGTCGYVGACLVLNYWNKTNPNEGVIPVAYLQANGNLKTEGYTL